MFPIIPVVCFGGLIASLLGLTWYDSLTREEKDDADRLAARLAWDWFNTSVENLTKSQLAAVSQEVQRRLG
jgi:hypothetical protein